MNDSDATPPPPPQPEGPIEQRSFLSDVASQYVAGLGVVGTVAGVKLAYDHFTAPKDPPPPPPAGSADELLPQ